MKLSIEVRPSDLIRKTKENGVIERAVYRALLNAGHNGVADIGQGTDAITFRLNGRCWTCRLHPSLKEQLDAVVFELATLPRTFELTFN